MLPHLLLHALIITAALAGRAEATCPSFPPPPNPVLRSIHHTQIVISEVANPVAPQYRRAA